MIPFLAPLRGRGRFLLASVLLFGSPLAALADGPDNSPLLEFAVGLPGKQAKLTWAAQPGVRYQVEKSTDLGAGTGGGGAGGWSRVALVEAGSDSAEWRDPEAVTTRCFYRVSKPAAEVFSLSPTVLQPLGGTILIHGQCLPPGSVLALEVEGLGLLSFPLEPLTTTTWRASVTATLPPGVRVISVSVRDSLGNILVGVDQQITVTDTGRAEDGPPSLPPSLRGIEKSQIKRQCLFNVGLKGRIAAPSDNDCDDSDFSGSSNAILGKKSYDMYNARGMDMTSFPGGNSFASIDDSDYSISDDDYDYSSAFNDDSDFSAAVSDDCDDGDPEPADFAIQRTAPAPSGMPGEVSFQQTDLALHCPAGPPLAWVRTYRSMKSCSSAHGAQWDFSYNISIEAIPATAGPAADRVLIRDGGGRSDVFHRQSDGTYRCDGFFREGSFSGDVFTLTFADTGKWVFKPLNGSPDAGKIEKITDRNGVSLTCAYNPAGMLDSVSNAFGRSISVFWSAVGDRIERIADSGGRSYDFTYYGAGESDGGEGMLKTVVPPGSGALRFTYTTGSGDPRLDGNLLSAFDGAGRLSESFGYSAATDPLHLDYDTCVSHDRNRVGPAGQVCVMSREPLSADQQPYGGYRVFEVDEIGRVNEFVCDAMHRTVSRKIFTGFTSPGTPVSSTTLALTGKLRPADPDWFQYSCDFNADHLCTRYTQPDGSQALVTYERDLHRSAPVRERGNARVFTLRSPSGETRTVSCDYEPGFGTPEAAMPGGPIKGIQVKCGRNPGGDVALKGGKSGVITTSPVHQDGDNHFDADLYNHRAVRSGGKGWFGQVKNSALVWSPRSNFSEDDDDCDGTFKGIAKKEEGGRHTPFHNKYRPSASKERGITINTSHVEYRLSQAAFDDHDNDCDSLPDDDIDFFRKILDRGEAGDNVGMLKRMVTAHGQSYQWTYDEHGNPLSVSTPIPGQGTVYQYNTLGQCVSVETQDGTRVFRKEFNHSPTTGELEIIIKRNAGAPVVSLTTTFVRDSYGRVTDVTDPGGATWSYEYNALDLCTRIQSPPVPARISSVLSYDDAGMLVRCDTDHLDASGAPHATNPAYSTFWQRDSRGRLTRVSSEERPVNPGPSDTPDSLGLGNFAACDLVRNDAGQIVKLSTPAACREQATDRTIDYEYDERGLLFRRAEGNIGGSTPLSLQCDYDAKGRIARTATLTTSPTNPADTFGYDGFGRLISYQDQMGNVSTQEYDNTGAVTASFFGELNDVPGSAGNQLLSQYTARTRVEVLKSNKTGDPNANKVSRNELKQYFLNGKIPTQERLSVSAAFFGYATEDDTISVQRFTPGSGAPPETELTTIHRSPAGLVESITLNGDLLQACEYDSAGRLSRCWNGACSVVLTRDNRGDLLLCGTTDHFRVVGTPGKTFSHTFTRDALGRVSSRSDGGGNTWSYAYDSLGRPLLISPPGRQPIACDYDGTSSAGPFTVRASCDIAGTGSPAVLGQSLARCGEVRSSSNSSGDTTVFQNDAAGRLVSCDFPDGTHETTTYDLRGLPVTGYLTDSTGVDVSYNDLGRVISETLTPPVGVTPSPPTIYQHDGLGRCVHAEQGSSIVAFTYDSLSNPVSQSQSTSSGTATVSSIFNHRGRTKVSYPGGDSYDEVRGPHGELLSITKTGQPAPKIVREHLGYRVWRETRDNGTVTVHHYRADGEAPPAGAPDASFDRCVDTTVTKGGTTLSRMITRRDPDQSVSRIETSYSEAPDAAGRTQSITRDGLGRLTACLTEAREIAGGPLLPVDSVSYELNADGLRVSELRNGVAGTYTQASALPPADRQMGQYSSWPGGPITWDDAGNLLQMQRGTQPGLHFECDAQGRVLAVRETDASGVPTNLLAEFSYDALGRVMLHKIHHGATLPPVQTSFVYDGAVCIQELSETGAVESTYVCANGNPVALESGTSSYQIHRGCPGGGRNLPSSGFRVALLTDGSGSPSHRYDCDDAGKPVFLDAAGLPATDVGPIKWMAPESLWVSQTGMFHGAGGVYSPDLGVSASKKAKVRFKAGADLSTKVNY